MSYYSKVIAAVVGLIVLFASRYGIDLEGQHEVIVDALTAIATAVGFYLAKNKPTKREQHKEEKATVREATKEIKEGQ